MPFHVRGDGGNRSIDKLITLKEAFLLLFREFRNQVRKVPGKKLQEKVSILNPLEGDENALYSGLVLALSVHFLLDLVKNLLLCLNLVEQCHLLSESLFSARFCATDDLFT